MNFLGVFFLAVGGEEGDFFFGRFATVYVGAAKRRGDIESLAARTHVRWERPRSTLIPEPDKAVTRAGLLLQPKAAI